MHGYLLVVFKACHGHNKLEKKKVQFNWKIDLKIKQQVVLYCYGSDLYLADNH